jgi:hypothetical protein
MQQGNVTACGLCITPATQQLSCCSKVKASSHMLQLTCAWQKGASIDQGQQCPPVNACGNKVVLWSLDILDVMCEVVGGCHLERKTSRAPACFCDWSGKACRTAGCIMHKLCTLVHKPVEASWCTPKLAKQQLLVDSTRCLTVSRMS